MSRIPSALVLSDDVSDERAGMCASEILLPLHEDSSVQIEATGLKQKASGRKVFGSSSVRVQVKLVVEL